MNQNLTNSVIEVLHNLLFKLMILCCGSHTHEKMILIKILGDVAQYFCHYLTFQTYYSFQSQIKFKALVFCLSSTCFQPSNTKNVMSKQTLQVLSVWDPLDRTRRNAAQSDSVVQMIGLSDDLEEN